jgi:hypothetical protein
MSMMNSMSNAHQQDPPFTSVSRPRTGLWLLIPAIALYYVSSQTPDELNTVQPQVICFALALALVVFVNWSSLVTSLSKVKLSTSFHIGWLLILGRLLSWILLALCALLTIIIVTINVDSVQKMVSDRFVLQEYSNNPFTICHHLAQLTEAQQTVYYHSFDGYACQYDDTRWIYKEGVDIRQINGIPTIDGLIPGAVVIIGRKGGIPAESMSSFIQLASSLSSSHSLRTFVDDQGAITTLSFCYQCTTGQ